MLAPALLAVAALAVIAVVIAATSGGGKKTGAGISTPHTTAARTSASKSPKAGTDARSTSTSSAHGTSTSSAHRTATSSVHSATTPSSSSPAITPSPNPPASSSSTTATPPSSGGGTSAATPAGAVEQFYEAAANHQYSTAWSLADANLQGQLGGYSSFQNTFSRVRSITFHKAELLPGSTASAATVSVSTTSVQTDQTQQCTGTARTVRSSSAGAWQVDQISIHC
jgi:hypothetical protein